MLQYAISSLGFQGIWSCFIKTPCFSPAIHPRFWARTMAALWHFLMWQQVQPVVVFLDLLVPEKNAI